MKTSMHQTIRLTAGLLAAGLVFSACGSDIDEGDDTAGDNPDMSVPEGPWTFTDGSGEVVTADQRPSRIIAHAGEAAALMSFGIRRSASTRTSRSRPTRTSRTWTSAASRSSVRSGARSTSRRPRPCGPI